MECDQINTELELNKNQQQQQKSPYQNCRTQYMYNKLRRQRKKTMLIEIKRHKKWRGKVKLMYVAIPTYVAKEVVQGGDHMVTPSRSVPEQTKDVPMNKQLHKNYAVGSVDSPLQFSRTVRLRSANRRKRTRIKADAQQQVPNHQRLLRQTNSLNTGISPRSKRTKMAPNSQMTSRLGKGIPGKVRKEPMDVRSLKVGENRKGMEKRTPMSLSEGSAAEQALVCQSKDSSEVESDEDVDEDMDLDDEDVVKNNEEVVSTRKERVYWNWKRRKKRRKRRRDSSWRWRRGPRSWTRPKEFKKSEILLGEKKRA
ncbi:MAG: hypothetical protein GY820_29015, partial [Gammaproteobacteria bacterium]|nr:hypothetical protein [Gammaproteobacteria bacterium]